MTWGSYLTVASAAAVLAVLAEAPARADARLTGLADVSFGTLVSPVDVSISDNVCVYSARGGAFSFVGYGVRATGTGSGGAYVLASGPRTLPYEVYWTDAPNQTGGTQILAGVLSPGFDNSALFQSCAFQPNGTATLTVMIRAAQIAAATAGSYSGVLTITITPE